MFTCVGWQVTLCDQETFSAEHIRQQQNAKKDKYEKVIRISSNWTSQGTSQQISVARVNKNCTNYNFLITLITKSSL